MGLDSATAVRWGTVEKTMERLNARNKRLRIINDALFIKSKDGDPLYCWNGGSESFVYVRKVDWIKASPAIRTTEACILLRCQIGFFKGRVSELGLTPKRAVEGVVGIPRQTAHVYWSINDLVEIIREAPMRVSNRDFASEQELRRLFAQGYTTYKRTSNGDFLPVWEESIY